MKFFDPTGGTRRDKEKESTYPIVSSLAGKVVGILSNEWPSFDSMSIRFQEQLVAKHKVSKIIDYKIPRSCAAPDALLEKVVAECDAAIVGLGN